MNITDIKSNTLDITRQCKKKKLEQDANTTYMDTQKQLRLKYIQYSKIAKQNRKMKILTKTLNNENI